MIDTSSIPLRRLDRSKIHDIQYHISENHVAQLARRIGLRKLKIEMIKGEVEPTDKGWELRLKLKGVATQSCVISAAPIHQKFEIDIIRAYVFAEKDLPSEMSWTLEFNVDLEPIPAELELDDVVAEEILLDLPEFPRLHKYKDEEIWQYDPDGQVEDDPSTRPFANLKELMSAKKGKDS